jgi:hypothetical protein
MATNILSVNSRAVAAYSDRLRTMSRSALPNAARNTLNAAALDVKQRTMPKESDVFTHRSPSFFKSQSRVQFAKGYDINNMHAVVGFVRNQGAKESGHATENLQQQETGGKIEARSFIALKGARASGSWAKNVREKNRMKDIKNKIVDYKDAPGQSPKLKFRNAMLRAGVGGLVIGSYLTAKGNRILWRVNSLGGGLEGKPKLTPLYAVKGNRSVQVRQTNFMKKAATKSNAEMGNIFVKMAEREFNRVR